MDVIINYLSYLKHSHGGLVSMKKALKKALRLSSISLLVLSSYTHASGFKMEFQSASVLGDAGEAAVVEDASTNWYNSAGLVYLPQQVVFSGIDVYQSTTFTGTTVAPSTLPPPVPGVGFSAAGSVSSHPNAFIPAFHYAYPFNPDWAVGISVTPAWGMMEDYGENSITRYNLTRIYTRTLDVAPSVAVRLNDQWSFGIGPDFHYFSVQSKSHVRTEGPFPFGTEGDSISRFTGNRWNYGAHAGLLFRLNDATRIGLNYRTKIVMKLHGYSDFAFDGGQSFESNSFQLTIPLPPVTTLSAYHDITPRWAMMGTIAYDQWSVLRQYVATGYITPVSPTTATTTTVVSTQDLYNTFDFSVGTHYVLNDKWMLRGSVKYEPTPTISKYRALNFPDGQKLGFQIGSRYHFNKKMALDLLYGHVFTRMAHINDVNPVTAATAEGHVYTKIDLVGAQLVWNL